MAESNPSDQQLSGKLAKAAKTAAIGGGLLFFSPVLMIFSPVLVPAYILYWIYRYTTGKQPVGSNLVAKAQEKITDTAAGVKDKVEDVKNKVAETGQKIVDAAEDLAKNNIVTNTGEKIVDAVEDAAKNNIVTKTGEKIVDTAEDLVKGGISQVSDVAEGAKNAVENLGKDILNLGGLGGGARKSAGK